MLGLGNILTKGGALLGFPNKYSFNFDGSNDNLEITDGDIPSGDESRTISAWINADVLSGDQGLVFTGKFNTNQQFTLAFLSSNANKLSVWGYSNDFTGTTTLSTGTWYHIVAVYDSSASNLKTYINGTVDINTTVSTNFNTTFGKTIIGARDGGSYFNGKIDEVAIWNTALDASTIAKLGSKPLDLTKYSASNLKLWLRAGDKVLPESDTSIARSDFYTDFDGTNDYVSVADNDDLSFGSGSADSPLSISAWINPVDATNFTIVSKGVFSTDAEYIFQLDGDDKLFFGLYDESVDNTYEGAYFNTALTSYQGSWFHVCVTYNGVGGTSANAGVKLYIDGVEKSTSLIGGGTYVAMENLGGELEIGRISSTYADGKISNLALYKTQLDAQTIKQFAKSRYTPMRDNRFSVVDFDGSDDRVDCGQIDVSGQNITLSAWVYRDGTGDDVIAGRWSTNGAMLYCSGEYVRWYINSGLATTTIPDKTWVHIVGTFDGVNRKIYKDGVLEDTDADTSTIVNPSQNFEIGNAEYHGSVGFIGSISSVSLYNTAKSAEEIYAIYQQGITYDESSLSGLVGYWRMGDDTSKAYPTIADSSSNSNDGTIENGASDDIVQQMVAGYDMGAFESSSEELGGEKITNGTFDSNISNWTNFDSNRGDISYSSGRLRIDNTTGTGFTTAQFTTAFTSGKIYKVSFDYYHISGATSSTINLFLDTSDQIVPSITSGQTTTAYMSATSSRSKFSIGYGGGAVYELDNISVKEVLQSDLSDTYPAIIDVNEPVLGADIWDNDYSSGTGSWVANSGNGLENDSGAIKITYVDSSNGAFVYLKDSSDLSDDLVVGKTYKLTFDAKVNSGSSVTPHIGDGSSGATNISTTTVTETSFTKKIIYFTATSASDQYLNTINMGTGEIIWLKNLALKELSGNVGTMTNQDSADLVYSSVLPDQSFLTGVNSSYGFGSFDGTNDIVTASAVNTDYKSFSVWVKPTSTITKSSGGEPIGSFFTGGFGVIWIGEFSSADTDELITLYDGTRTTWENAGSASFPNDSWTHLALVWDGSKYQIYYNGQPQTTTTNATHVPLKDNQSIFIGRGGASRSEFFDGDISGVALWNKSLSASEVSAIYTAGRHTNLLDSYSDNLITYLAFGNSDATSGVEDTSSTIYDRSGNSNHGTVSGTTLQSPPNAEPNGYAKGDTNRSTTTP